MIHAYNKLYLQQAQAAMGSLFDHGLAVMTPREFTKAFLSSRVASAWEQAHPNYLAGKSGVELFWEMTGRQTRSEQVSFERSPAYWCGYLLCYAQWYFGTSFAVLLHTVPLDEMLQLYPALHEADISKSIAVYHQRLYPESALKAWRKKRRLSQSELALISSVNLRSIKAYEQGDLDISKAQYDTLSNLSKALNCEVKDLIS